ncbi:acyl-CoA thioesterase [Alteromonas sp. ASW11-19]|uniref:Acyl-CoA thioesterase n=1 Tax=Alteromonas salexigens TaxID=2982530 RepID=A0ABT2VMV6_9ALTE|nr:acyl-CoA thioesterase [Alteromonas salexigens]MCU7553571.1 acyl-CoA thioesterase [Alteromonas salexigens]
MSDITPSLQDYPYQITLATRWQDNDAYGHINNVAYYSFFDTAINRFLIEQGGLDVQRGQVVAYVVSSQCQYLAPASYPEAMHVGMRVVKIGRSSVTYGLAVYAGDGQRRVAHGLVVQVFVNRQTDQAVPLPVKVQTALETIKEGL